MAKTGNGTLWKILIWAAGALIAIGVAYATIGNNTDRIKTIEPEVKLNSNHRLQDEIDTQYVKKRLENIETMQKAILDEVRKR
ncbi:MAG: hypothetical protein ACFFFO_17715 [Candidatus Thorarchaeota archaeon]